MPAVTLTIEVFEELRAECGGVCLSCGQLHFEIEPDSHRLRCDFCDEHRVYGAESLLAMGRVI